MIEKLLIIYFTLCVVNLCKQLCLPYGGGSPFLLLDFLLGPLFLILDFIYDYKETRRLEK